MADPLIASLMSSTPEVRPAPGWDVATMLVTVKAYPAIAKASGESVCVAGVRLDGPQREWMRLFPVGFRNLPDDKQFAKYRVVRLRVKRGSSDRRTESFKPDLDSVVLGPALSTDHQTWRRRWEVVAPLADTTTACSLARDAAARGQDAPSLGLIRPASVTGVKIDANPDFDPDAPPIYDADLFGNERQILPAAPLLMKYQYTCRADGCRGHEQSLIDWESGQLARRNIHHGFEEAARRHRERFLTEIAGPTKDLHFFVGNQHQHPQSFLVLGCFYPEVGNQPQPSLEF